MFRALKLTGNLTRPTIYNLGRQATPATALWNNNTSYGNQRYASSGAPSAEEITQRVTDVVKAFEKIDANKVTDTSHFKNDLGIDSLDSVELVLAMEDEFCVEIPDEASDNINSVPDAVQYFLTNPHVK